MTLSELIELKEDINVCKLMLFKEEITTIPQETRFKIWLPKLESAQEKLSNFILENEGKDIIF
ncbi:hypothetical protein G5T04_08535 [Lactobacillus salivarius]|uniref:hypothetical protein n=1 Tax=Ligilactobacillus salivarius TaxID=1624 RepID=UPI0013CA6CE9|nr:hypothetical protein [Ligilactobacillus salivarius]NGG72713.1 hypothetical protein [Ligilactobacillus salivarius]